MKRAELVIRDQRDKEALVSRLKRLPLDKPVKVTVERHRERRSGAQLRTHWWRLNGLVSDLAEDTGHSAEELHEALKLMFVAPKPVVVNGHTFEVRSTKLLDVAEMADFLTRVEAWAAETFGYEMPSPIPRVVREDMPA